MLGWSSKVFEGTISTAHFYCPLLISIAISDGVAYMRNITVINTINGSCENLSFGSAANYANLDHIDCNGCSDSLYPEI